MILSHSDARELIVEFFHRLSDNLEDPEPQYEEMFEDMPAVEKENLYKVLKPFIDEYGT